ncbi:uncharacterized protein LOC129909201 [Episyrphus balteatus]|uniref:uncharacterized protein LOC129909201 n=1 Tax=Episyrphus balteatus TaxID=286459 RepID=UPI00248525C3|nr:uncharacterized protein LOC129909201 [Episyrphus balteatus]
MDLFEPNLVTKKEVRFAEGLVQAIPLPEENFGDIFGGIIKSGQWGWLTKGSRLCITSLRSGQSISKYDFDASNGFGVCIITCVSEIQMPYLKDTLIAIGIQYADSPGGLVVLYSVEESTVICCIDLKYKITCCKFISHEVSQHTILQNMNGCLAVGTDGGSVLLVDLNLNNADIPAAKEDVGISLVPCHIVDSSMSLLHLHRHFQHCQQEGVHFGIQLEVLDNAEFIQSLLPIDLILGLAVGLADGRLVFYDLTDMQVFYVAPPQERSSPLVKISSMEPPDDPRPCVYVWAFHENYQNSMAVMHSLMYEKRVVTDEGFCYFENFQVSSVRLQLPLNCPKSVPIACQAISKAPSHGNEETISLCAIVWKQEQETQTEVLLFDINQWYKEEMPYVGDWREDPSYLASFVLPGLSCLDMYFNPNTISLFNSIQRPEEHFYPISLSFDSIGLGEKSCLHLNWPGVQNRVIDVLRSQGSLALLDPNPIFMEVLNARLLPQFSGLNYKATFSLKAKRETLLSVAIENNCNGLLKECAKNWSDGSHQGTSLSEGLSLSTLTDWLWVRASCIKERCNKLCKVLFDHSGYTLDQREKQELCYISKQLRTLAEVSSDIIAKFGENIPSDVLSTLESQGNSIRMASDYQEILLWLLNIGLLPEASRLTRSLENELNLVPYPYESLHGFYEKRRLEFMRYSSRKARSCYLLFIDSFLEHSFKGNTLRDSWQESGGDGLYPPTSVQAMLRIMLIPDVSFENKCALFLYFFLDLNMAIEDKRYEPIVQNFIKFPSVFKLSASLIKQIQAFWNLDHCHFQAAVDEFISPFNKDHVCPQWQIELFIASLLDQIESNLALRVLEAKSLPISPLLQLNTYLANDLISEAFHFARSEKDEELLKLFFSRCLLMKKFGVIRDLALTESEGKLVQSLLKSSKNRSAEDLSFVYLLQKYKYIEAVAYQDEISKDRDIQRAVDELSKGRNNQTAMDVDTPSLILSAYHTTMTPVTKNISDVYLKIKKRIKNKETEQNSPYPLSCQLIKQNATDLLGGIYHSSALGTHFASHYWDQQKSEGNALQQSTNAPFLRCPQISLSYSEYNPREVISYPEPFKPAQKRRLDNSPIDSDKTSKTRENPKKRRRILGRYDFELSTSDNLLTHFKNSSTYNPDVSILTKINQKTPSRDNSLFLETPYVKNTPTDNASSQVPEKLNTALPGILKVSQPKTSIDETDRSVKAPSEEPEKKKDFEEEKIIRFVLPVDESLEQINERDLSVESEEVLQEPLEKSQRPYSGPSTRKSLRSTTSYSLIPMSKNELQDILDKVKNQESKLESTIKTTSSQIEKNSLFTKSQSNEVTQKLSDIAQFNEPKTSEDFGSKFKQQEHQTKTMLNYSSCTPISRNELQDILDKVKNEAPKNLSSAKTTSLFESSSSVSKIQSDILQVTEPKTNIDFGTNIIRSKEENTFASFSFTNASTKRFESETISMDFTTDKSNTRKFESLSNLDSNSSSTIKPPKRALSQSSDSNSNDSSIQRNRKQLKGRASIHNSSGDVSEYKTPTEPAVEKITTTKTVFSTDTLIDFKPHTSSSKVCSTESRFNKVIMETESKLDSEKSPSKVTFSERTTVIGELTYLPTMEVSQNLPEPSSVTLQPSEKEQMLDTTVGMTLYDTMGFEENLLEPQQKQQPESENSSSLDTYDNIEAQEEESTNSELNYLDGKTSENEEVVDDGSGSSIILLSSRSSSRAISRNQDSNDVAQRHISIDDDENDYEENYDDSDDDDGNDNNEEDADEDEDESVEIIESDGSEDLSNSFSNKIRDVTSTSTSSSLASFVFSENSSHSDRLLQETMKVKNIEDSSNSQSLSASTKYKTLHSGEKDDVEQQKASDCKDTSESEFKLSVTSESINETENNAVIIEEEQVARKTSSSCDVEVVDLIEEPESTEQNYANNVIIFGDQQNKVTETDNEVAVQLEEPVVENVQKQAEDSTHQSEIAEQSNVQNDEENMETEDIVVLYKETPHETLDQSQLEPNVSEIEESQKEKPEVQSIEAKSEEKEKIDIVSVESKEADKTEDVCESQLQPTEEVKELDEHKEICETTSTDEKIEEKTVLAEENDDKLKSNEIQDVEIAMPSKVVEVVEVVEAESTVNIDKTIQIKDVADDKKQKQLSDEVELTPRLRSQSFSKNLSNEKVVVASPRTRRNSRSGSMPPLKKPTEVESNISTSNVDSVDEENKKQSNVDVELTPKLRNRRSSSVSQNLTTEIDITASPSTRRLSRGGSVPPSTANQIVTRRRSLLLETLDENSTPDSPSSRTRSKIRSDSIDDVESSTVSNVKRSRLSSISSITSIEQPQTPKTRRRSSMSVDKEVVSTPSKAVGTPKAIFSKAINTDAINTPIKTPRRLSVSKKESPSDDTSPTTSKSRVQKREEKDSSKSPQDEPESSQNEDYTLSRRLTRTQLAAMERNKALSKQLVMSPVIKKRRGSNTTDFDSPPDVKGSDNESTSSRMSHISTASRRVTRSLALKENITDDMVSIASSTESSKRKRKRVKEQISPIAALKVIPEEGPSGSEGSEASNKRTTRHKK